MKGRFVEIDICERKVGFVLSVGPVSLWLRPAVADDILETLARALAVEEGQNADPSTPKPAAAPRRKVFS